MRLIRMVGIAAMAAVAMGVVGVSGASASFDTALTPVEVELVQIVHYLDADATS